MSEVKEVDCWCPLAERQAKLRGRVVGRRQSPVFHVTDCLLDCPLKRAFGCLIDKKLECGRW